MILNEYKSILEENKYKYNFRENGNYVEIRKDYDNVEDYINKSLLFNDFFENIKYSKNGNIVTIETEGFNPNDSEDPNRFDVEKVDIAIKCGYKVIKSNASSVDKNNNIYHFNITNTVDDFKILLQYDVSSKFNSHTKEILIIIGSIVVIIASWIGVFVLKGKNN